MAGATDGKRNLCGGEFPNKTADFASGGAEFQNSSLRCRRTRLVPGKIRSEIGLGRGKSSEGEEGATFPRPSPASERILPVNERERLQRRLLKQRHWRSGGCYATKCNNRHNRLLHYFASQGLGGDPDS